MIESLSKELTSGKYRPGDKFPSEAALVQQFQTSRITIGRALRELTQQGLIERRPGSGTYVRNELDSKPERVFGLLIPNLGETEIFEPICHGMATAPEAKGHALLWGHAAEEGQSKPVQALSLCSQFIHQKVSGVFFAPLERDAEGDATNIEIVSQLERARIPVILLDRCVMRYPERSHYDLVGIDNRRAGHVAAEHLLRLGVKRIAFVGYAKAAPTIEARVAGFREALMRHGVEARGHSIHLVDAIEPSTAHLFKRERIDGYVCGNDRIAGELMHALLAAGVGIPDDARIVGIDDVEYASLLPVPLSTVHQPCRAIGRAAMIAMVERIADPGMLARDILLETKLVIRSSCGARERDAKA